MWPSLRMHACAQPHHPGRYRATTAVRAVLALLGLISTARTQIKGKIHAPTRGSLDTPRGVSVFSSLFKIRPKKNKKNIALKLVWGKQNLQAKEVYLFLHRITEAVIKDPTFPHMYSAWFYTLPGYTTTV